MGHGSALSLDALQLLLLLGPLLADGTEMCRGRGVCIQFGGSDRLRGAEEGLCGVDWVGQGVCHKVGTHVVNLTKGLSGLGCATCNTSYDSWQMLSAVTTVCATTTPHARVSSLLVHQGCITARV